MKAIDIKCPVEKCSVEAGQRCKLVDMVNNPMMGGFHQKRVTEAQKRPNQDAKKLLRSSNRVVQL